MRELKYREAILEATDVCMAADQNVYVMGLGVPDPKGIFGTTLGLLEKYGTERVLDMPTSENGMTGVAIGSALLGMRPLMTHQRVDFFLLALDQLINNAAKWHYMFGGQLKVPLTIRLIIGRGWGQGPQHSQSLFSLFSHIPGLKVVVPATPADAKGLLVSALKDDNPVIYLEHRWLHETFGDVPEGMYQVPLGKARIMEPGTDITIVSFSHMTLVAKQAWQELKKLGISAELVDLRTLVPFDNETVIQSVSKTKRLLVLEGDWQFCGFGAEVIAQVVEAIGDQLKSNPMRLAHPDYPTPTSWKLANNYYPLHDDVMRAVLKILGRNEVVQMVDRSKPLDQPNAQFKGPF